MRTIFAKDLSQVGRIHDWNQRKKSEQEPGHVQFVRFNIYAQRKWNCINPTSGLQISEVRNQWVDGLMNLSFAKRLWELFQALIDHGLSGIQAQLGCSVDLVMAAIEETINNFFRQALQLATFTLRLEAIDNGD